MFVEGDVYWHGDTGVPRDVDVGFPAPPFPSIDPRNPPSEGGLQIVAGGDIDLNAGGSGGNGGITTMASGSNPPPANPSGVPEPGTWAMLLVGLGLVGVAARDGKSRAIG